LRCPPAARRCDGADFDVVVLAVAVMLAPPEVAGAPAVVADVADGELDELLEATEHPVASTQHTTALTRRAHRDTRAPLTGLRLAAGRAESHV
jgi:hypothetical protein